MAGVRREHPEDDEARALWQWAQYIPVLRDHLAHVPNGGKRNAKEAARMKGMGVRPGVSDYILPVPRGAFHGLFVELKAGTNNPTAEQQGWIERVRRHGYAAYCATGADQARAVFRWYLSLPVPDTEFEHPALTMILAAENQQCPG